MQRSVLIVGAGPTGLVLALWLTKLGVSVRVLDKASGPGTTSRALAVQARTLELYRQLDLTEAVLEQGHRVEAANIWVEGEHKATLRLGAIGEGMTPHPFLHIFPQDRHERLLVERLEALGVRVERDTEVLGFIEQEDGVSARFRGPDGQEHACAASYIVGCDGARSMVRQAIGADFPGGTYRQTFYVADIEGSGPALDGNLHVDLDEADFIAVFGLDGGRNARLVGTVRDERPADAGALRFEDVSHRAIGAMKLQVTKVNWFSTYRVHHRVADRFRRGRAFIAGDAGHVHSPAGGQGMNTGIGDAINLAWKLAAVLHGEARESLLDSYEAERIVFARKLVQTTDRAFSFVSAEGRLADLVRTRLAPALLPLLSASHAAREFMFRTVSQTMLTYRGGPLAEGRAGHVHGGDRLPWAPADGADNFESLAAIIWQAHVYGTASEAMRAWCDAHAVPLHVFAWKPAHEAAGLARDAAYLLRPDSYVAVADASGDPEHFDRYFAGHGLDLVTTAAADLDRSALNSGGVAPT